MEDNNIIIKTNDKIQKKENKKKKYEIKFSAIIDDNRKISDETSKDYDINFAEFTTNLLLMSSKINTTNKISCLTLLSFANHQRKNSLYTYYINKKIFKYLQIQKSIEAFIYIRTLYRAAYFLEKEKIFFYGKKFVDQAENLSKNSKIDNESTNLLNGVKKKIYKGIEKYFDLHIKKFRDVENPENLTGEKYIKLINLFNELNANTYIQNHINSIQNIDNNNNDLYLYLLNKKWFTKAFLFLLDYKKIRDNIIKDNNYFSIAFNPDYCYQKYFDINEPLKNKDYKYNSFPCSIDNYSIINWTDNLYDPLNEDENYILKKNLIQGKDYFLLEKEDFDFLQNLFGVTNIIKRKKNCIEFIEIKAMILEEKLYKKENNYLLRKRHFQIRKNYKIKDLKEKIIRCVDYNIEKEKNNNNIKIVKEGENNNENKETDEIMIDANKNMDQYNIYFYLLEKTKKDILMEICISLSNKLPKYESIFLHNIQFISEDSFVSNLFSSYDMSKYILIIEIQNKNSNKFISQIFSMNSLYYCTSCKKEINSLEKSYKCNICNYSLYCSESCANKDLIHYKLDEIYLNQYLYEQFDLVTFLKKNILELPMIKPESRKGLVGLANLGNTCYINSTLQCLSNSNDLTKYFLLEYFRNDINTGNKLGSNGIIALKYHNLIKRMWCGTEDKIIPNVFVDTFKKIKKQFEGYRQQDAQEFLSVLLDQLHEDLNRITDKPYIELLEKQNNEDDLIASKRWWDLHKKREDSIIIDLFNGQLKSETICQVCKKSSITYDPFMSLCVPLPNSKKHLSFKIFCGKDCIYFDFQFNENSTISDLKKGAINYIYQLTGNTKFDLETVILDANKNISEIISTDITGKNFKGPVQLRNVLINNEIVFYEKSKEKSNDYMNIFIYPIEHQKPDLNYYTYYNQNNPIQLKYISYPLFFQMKKDETLNQLYNIAFQRIKSQNFFIQEKFNYFVKNNDNRKILDLNIIHGKDTKNQSFFSYFFSWEDTCKFCGESNNKNYYCSISNLGGYNKTLEEAFDKFKSPIILLATSECYNLFGEKTIYENCPLFNGLSESNNLADKFTYENILLKNCLELFISNENFQEDDSWFCSQCKKLQKSKQKLQIYKPPNYLIILLKRYNFKKNYGNIYYGEKNNSFITYPINNFDIREYIVGPEKNKAIYDLYGVIEHYGTMNQGHYTAICKNNDKWISYNDSNLSISKNPVSKNAYVLFYKMQNNNG